MSTSEETETVEAMRAHGARHGAKVLDPTPEPLRELTGDRCAPMNAHWQSHQVCIPAAVRPEQLLDPRFWKGVSDVLRPGDRVWADWEDGSFAALLKVQQSGPAGVVIGVEMLHGTDVPLGQRDAGVLNTVGGRIAYNGPVRRYGAFFGDRLLKEGFQTHGQAATYLNSWLRVQQASS